jgi:hypothetical protein
MPRNQAIDLVIKTEKRGKADIGGNSGRGKTTQAVGGRNKMLVGLAALIGGGLITAASYAAADPGEEYFLFYGPMVFGFIYTLIGLVEWLRNM